MKKLLTACLLTTALCGASSATTILSEGFEGTFPPDGWTQNSVDQSTTWVHTGSYSAKLGAANDYLITPTLTNAQTLTYWTYTTSADPDIIVETSTSVSGPWTAVTGSPFSGNTQQWNERIITLASSEILYAKIRKSGSGTLYVDDVSADDAPAGNSAPVLAAIGDQSVIISNELTFAVSATDANGDDIVLSATNLPGDAVFNTVTNSSAVTNTFTWTSAAPTGTYSVTFLADDGTTNDSETITITVNEQPVLPDDVLFDFRNDADLYGALDNQAGPVTYTNNGLVSTFSVDTGVMNRSASGFGVDAGLIDQSDKFDVGEWIDITFEVDVILTNITVSSWNAGTDEAVIEVGGVSNGVITSTGSQSFNILVSSNEVLRVSCTEGTLGNGFSLDSLAVKIDKPVPPVLEAIGNQSVIVSNELSFTVSATDANLGDDMVLYATNLPGDAEFNTVTNAGTAASTFTWASAAPAGTYTPTFYADDGITQVSETITITVKEKPVLLISEVADPAGTGGGNYRFVELWNAGTNTIDLAADSWTLSMQDNGDANDWRDVPLTGSIGPTGVYVVAYSTTNFQAAYGFAPDQESATVIAGNGRDTYALFYGGDHTSGLLIDIYGEIDVDGDGTAWDYKDDRAERNNPILEPNTTWTASEWTISVNTYTNEFNPGIHGPTPEFVGLEDLEVILGSNLTLTVTATNVVYTNEVITLSATELPGGATFPTVEGTGTVSGTLSWSPADTGYYTASFAADGIVDTTTESITIHVISLEQPVISLTIPTGGPLTLAWPTSAGSSFNVLTNSNLLDTNGWGNANLIPFLDGDSYKVTNAIGSDALLFYKLESQ